jgi:hypothetical protein
LLDIMPLDLFLWEYIKDWVYATHVPDIPLQPWYHDVMATVILDTADKT